MKKRQELLKKAKTLHPDDIEYKNILYLLLYM
jgi:hypothetical protein